MGQELDGLLSLGEERHDKRVNFTLDFFPEDIFKVTQMRENIILTEISDLSWIRKHRLESKIVQWTTTLGTNSQRKKEPQKSEL